MLWTVESVVTEDKLRRCRFHEMRGQWDWIPSGTSFHIDEGNESMNYRNNDCNMEGEALTENLATAVFVQQTNKFK